MSCILVHISRMSLDIIYLGISNSFGHRFELMNLGRKNVVEALLCCVDDF